MSRGLSEEFLRAMRNKLDHGRKRGRVAWDTHWGEKGECHFHTSDVSGFLVDRLQHEVAELIIAVHEGKGILDEAADVANFAMFIADYHGELD